MKRTLLAFVLTCSAFLLWAQTPNRINLRAEVKDTTNEIMAFATVMLLNPSDSTLVNFTRTDAEGVFVFKNIKNTDYLLKISYVGYLPYQLHLKQQNKDPYDLGTLRLKPIAKELMEVVIRTAKAPLRMKGDTIEYDASTFKVPPGSTVEDLLRRLPGIEVDADGNIKAQGRDINRVYVDGKTFFGDDPKSATKNLGAEAISKVQVYNEKSEQAKLTGVDDGKKEKAMNLELKAEYKKGAFGKLTVAGGTEERWATRGNYNRFNAKSQLSFIGYGNNINQTGVNWDDYSEFKGQSTFSDFDNGDFGFNNGGGRVFYFGGDDDSPLNSFDGRGFTKNFGGGSNFNYDHKKTKFNASYFYNQTALDLDQYAFRQNFLESGTFSSTDTSRQDKFRRNHSINSRFESDLDSNNLLIVKAAFRLGYSENQDQNSQLFTGTDNTLSNRLSLDNSTDLNTLRANTSAIFRHRFKKKGRSLAFSAGYNASLSDGTENLSSLNEFFSAPTFTDQIRQLNNNDNNTQQYKASALYTDNLAKAWYLETFYNFSNTTNLIDRQTFDPLQGEVRIDELSVFYDNQVRYNRVGTGLRYSKKALNVTAGIAAQQIDLLGKYSVDSRSPLLADPINRGFFNVVPHINANYEFANNLWIDATYDYNVTEPRLNDLQPVRNVSNPAFRSEGNPDLSPERSHALEMSINYWNPANFSNVGMNIGSNLYDNQVVYSQTVELIDTIGIRTTTRPENVSGGSRNYAYMWSNFPIIKTKLTANIGGNGNLGNAPAFVNGVKNITENLGWGGRVGFNFTPTQKVQMNAGMNFNFNDIQYSISAEQNQKIRSQTYNAGLKVQLFAKIFVESNFNYNNYRNDRFDFNQSVPIWNASVRKLFGKKNRVEARLAAFDLLNKNVNITQNGTQNYVTRNVAETLARYFMLSVSYNVRGYENKLNQRGGWW